MSAVPNYKGKYVPCELRSRLALDRRLAMASRRLVEENISASVSRVEV
jgi:hypothetical protein